MFSVVIPAYNAAQFVSEAIESALNQTFAASEIIVIDDGSTDETQAVLEPYRDRITLVRTKNAGAAAARNTGLHQAAAEWVAFLDADDIWLPEKLALQKSVVDREPHVSVVYGGLRVFGRGSETDVFPPPASRVRKHLERRPPFFQTSTAVIRRSVALNVGGFDPAMDRAEDWDFWLRVARTGARFAKVDQIVTRYRLLDNSLSRDSHAVFAAQCRMLEKRLLECVPTWRRRIIRQLLLSRIEAQLAIQMRANGEPGFRKVMARSLLRYPIPTSMTDRRYKVALSMAIAGIGSFLNHLKRASYTVVT